jgi:hypothetical protein
MRMPEAGPLGETFADASDRAITGALFVKSSFGGCVESVVTVRTQRFFDPADFAEEDFGAATRFATGRAGFFEADFRAPD